MMDDAEEPIKILDDSEEKDVEKQRTRHILVDKIIIGTVKSELLNTGEFSEDSFRIYLSMENGKSDNFVVKKSNVESVGVHLNSIPYYMKFLKFTPSFYNYMSQIYPLENFSPSSRKECTRYMVIRFNDDLDDESRVFLMQFFKGDAVKVEYPITKEEQDWLKDSPNNKTEVVVDPVKRVCSVDTVDADADMNPPVVKKVRKNSCEQTALTDRVLRSRNPKSIKETELPEEEEFEDQLQVALAESLKTKPKGRKSKNSSSAHLVDRFPQYDNETKILTYDGVVISMEDYKCLDYRELLLDVVLDFHLTYIHNEVMDEKLRDRVFVYNSQMYNNLAINSNYNGWKSDENKDLSAAQKRYERVKAFHENVNIFEKDFLVIPCFDNGHWFLAIACYPYLNGCFDMKGNRLDDHAFLREKDDTTDLEDPLKFNCIVILDSVKSNPSRKTSAITHIRNLLYSEYEAKYKDSFSLDKVQIRGKSAKVPQQSNATDCGLFLLEFMEHFLIKKPIKDLRFPILVEDWFDPEIIYSKREEIATVMKKKIIEQSENGQLIDLPDIILYKETDPENITTVAIISNEENENDQENNNNAEDPLNELNNNGNDNNNEEEFNNNNDFYEADHNLNPSGISIVGLPVLNIEREDDDEPMDVDEGDEYPPSPALFDKLKNENPKETLNLNESINEFQDCSSQFHVSQENCCADGKNTETPEVIDIDD